MKTLGTYISSGVFKACYTIKEQDDRVALIGNGSQGRVTCKEDKDTLLAEKVLLDKLIKHGIPALVTKISLLANPNIEKGRIWALTCPRYDWHSKGGYGNISARQFEILSDMAATMDAKKISIHDPQFLFSALSDDVVVSDPLDVAIGEEENKIPYWARTYGRPLRPLLDAYRFRQKKAV